ncbi:hypothetical protein ABPG72_018083 [Tetrahymena utriculariae]
MSQMIMQSMCNISMNNMSNMLLPSIQNQVEFQPQQLNQSCNSQRIENSNINQNVSIYAASFAAQSSNQAEIYSASACPSNATESIMLSKQTSKLSKQFESKKLELCSKKLSSESSISQQGEQTKYSSNESEEHSSDQEKLAVKINCYEYYSSSSSCRYYGGKNENNQSNNADNRNCNCNPALACDYNYNQKIAFNNSNSSCFCKGSFSGGFRGFRGFRPSCCCCCCRSRGGVGLTNSYSLSTSDSSSSSSSSNSAIQNDDHFFEFNNFQNITREEAIQPLLQGSIRQILSNGPVVGLYERESEEEWNSFVNKLLAYFGERAGSRAKANEEIKSIMEQHKTELTDLLKDLGLQYGKCNIKEIIAKTESYVPCAAKRELDVAESTLRKNNQNINELRIEGSKVRLSILQGLQKSGKYTQISDLEERISMIIEGRIEELKKLEKKIEGLRLKMLSDSKYLRLQRLQALLKECFEMWEEADKNAGRDIQNNGKKLEELMMEEGNKYIDIIIKRIAASRTTGNVHIHHNLFWEGVDGEVDIAITDDQDREVLGLVEIKSRLYDIAAAFRQSGPLRLKSKKRLIIQSKLVDVPFDVPVFVVTTIPSHSFSLEFESKLKDSLNKYFSNTEPHLIDYSEVYRCLKPIYSNLISPLQWFDLYASKYLIIIDQSGQTQQQQEQQQTSQQQWNPHHHHCHHINSNQNLITKLQRGKALESECCCDEHNMSLETDDDHHDARDYSLLLRDQALLSLDSNRLSSPILSSQPSSDQMTDEEDNDHDEFYDVQNFKDFAIAQKLQNIKLFSLVQTNDEKSWSCQPWPWHQPQPQPQQQDLLLKSNGDFNEFGQDLLLQTQQSQQQQQEQQQQQQQEQQQQRQQDMNSELIVSGKDQQASNEKMNAATEKAKLRIKQMSKLKKSKEERKKKEAITESEENEERREQTEERREPVKKIQKVGYGKAQRLNLKGQQSQVRAKNSPTRQPYDDQIIKNPQTQIQY